MKKSTPIKLGLAIAACAISTSAIALVEEDYSFSKQANLHFNNAGMGVAVGDLNGNGIDEVVAGTYRLDGSNSGFSYRVGWDIDGNGSPKYWTDTKEVRGAGWVAQDVSIALYDRTIGDNKVEAVFAMFDGNSNVETNEFRYQYGTLNKNGNFEWLGYQQVAGFSKYSKIGVELFDIDQNGSPEIILMQEGNYKIGWNINSKGHSSDWTSHTLKYTGSYGSTRMIRGTSVTFAHLDRDNQPEMVIGNAITAVVTPNPASTVSITDKVLSYSIGYNVIASGPNKGNVMSWSPDIELKYQPEVSTTDYLDLVVLNTALGKDENLDRLIDTKEVPRSLDKLEKTFLFAGLDTGNGQSLDYMRFTPVNPSNNTNLVANPDFATGFSDWTYGPDDNNVSYENGMLCLGDIKLDRYWESQARTLVTVEKGKNYVVEFDAVADQDGRIAMNVQQLNSPHLVHHIDYSFMVKEGRQRYQFPFEVSEDMTGNPLTKIVFITGREQLPVDRFCLDNVRVTEVTDTSNDFANFPGNNNNNLIKNGSFDFGTLAGWHEKFGDGTANEENYEPSTRVENGAACSTQRDINYFFQQALSQNNITLETGESYSLSFDHKSPIGRAFDIKLGRDSAPWTSYMFKTFYTQGSGQGEAWEHAEFVFDMTKPTDTSAGLAIFFSSDVFTGAIYDDEDVCIDNVVLNKL